MRIYLPTTSTTARSLLDAGQLGVPLTGFAVTPGLRSQYADTDATTEDGLEELEYLALTAAAQASLRLIDSDPTAWRRRMVLAADVSDGAMTIHDDLDTGVVRLDEPLRLEQVAAVHVDDLSAVAVVAVAATAILRADLGADDAQDQVDDAEGNELSWYAPQELSALLDLD